jgi:hypothetical protein
VLFGSHARAIGIGGLVAVTGGAGLGFAFSRLLQDPPGTGPTAASVDAGMVLILGCGLGVAVGSALAAVLSAGPGMGERVSLGIVGGIGGPAAVGAVVGVVALVLGAASLGDVVTIAAVALFFLSPFAAVGALAGAAARAGMRRLSHRPTRAI